MVNAKYTFETGNCRRAADGNLEAKNWEYAPASNFNECLKACESDILCANFAYGADEGADNNAKAGRAK